MPDKWNLSGHLRTILPQQLDRRAAEQPLSHATCCNAADQWLEEIAGLRSERQRVTLTPADGFAAIWRSQETSPYAAHFLRRRRHGLARLAAKRRPQLRHVHDDAIRANAIRRVHIGLHC